MAAERAPLRTDPAPALRCSALGRTGAGPSSTGAGSMIRVSAPRAPSETCAESRAPIDAVDRDSSAGIVSCWNAAAWTGSIGLGVREPAKPGSATRARAAVSTDPTTNLGRRTRLGPYHTDGGDRGAGDLRCPLRLIAHAPSGALALTARRRLGREGGARLSSVASRGYVIARDGQWMTSTFS